MPPISANNPNLAGLASKVRIGLGGGVAPNIDSPTNTGPSTGVKAKAPGGVQTSNPNTIPSTYKAPASQQNAVSGNGSPGSYKGVAINAGSQADIQAQIAKIDAQQGTPTVSSSINQPSAIQAAPTGSMGSLIANTKPQPTFQGTVGSLVQNAQTGSPIAGSAAQGLMGISQSGSPQAQGYTGQLAGYGAGNIGIGQNAADILNRYGQLYSNIGRQGAALESGQLTTGTSPVARGNAAVTAQTTAEQQQAAAQGAQTALQGTAQELTAQGQAAQAANEAAGQSIANTGLQQGSLNSAGGLGIQGQQLLQSGLTSAAQLSQPQLGSIGQVPFSPLDQGQGSVLGSQGDGLNAAGQLLGQFQGAQALGAATGQGQAAVQATIPQLQSATTAARGISDTIAQFIDSNPQINASPAALANAAQQWIQGKQLTDPTYQTFFNYLNEYTNTLAPVLGVGGNPTNLKTEIAQGFVNARASGQSIKQVLSAMDQLAQQKITNIQSGAFGGGVTTTNPNDPLGIL